MLWKMVMADTIEVVDRGRPIAFSFEDLMRYHGPSAPGGVAHAFKVLERALPLLDPSRPCERREIVIETAFGGPGARRVRAGHSRRHGGALPRRPGARAPERGRTRERFVFRLGYRDAGVTLALRDGFVSDEFVDLARTAERTPEQERRLDLLKAEMAARVMGQPASAVYDVLE